MVPRTAPIFSVEHEPEHWEGVADCETVALVTVDAKPTDPPGTRSPTWSGGEASETGARPRVMGPTVRCTGRT